MIISSHIFVTNGYTFSKIGQRWSPAGGDVLTVISGREFGEQKASVSSSAYFNPIFPQEVPRQVLNHNSLF